MNIGGEEHDEIVKVFAYDGQSVWVDRNTAIYEVGNFLGGGAAGTVYECEHNKTGDHFALKILNPIGFKMISPVLLRRCAIVSKGKVLSDALERSRDGLTLENIWWLINGSTKQYHCAYYSEKSGSLKELSLTHCCQLWGADPVSVGEDETGDSDATMEVMQTSVGPKVIVPAVPPRYAEFVRKRRRIFREIKNMRKISKHVNVIRLENVLELTQESKCTIFLVMELANGGELFDRIKLDCGAREDTARVYFLQLLEGVRHCHQQGVCHRDLKPENLLLQDASERCVTTLKIADFGFSARFAMGTSFDMAEYASRSGMPVPNAVPCGESPLRVLKSVVGSPFYVAPEVLQARGYDGPKADIWSLGVILYAMLAGNLPFEQELATCKRFRLFCKWVRELTPMKGYAFWEHPDISYPSWLFSSKFSSEAKSLIIAMLHPDPDMRINVVLAMSHPLLMRSDSETYVWNDSTPSLPVTPFVAAEAHIEAQSRVDIDHETNTSLQTPLQSGLHTIDDELDEGKKNTYHNEDDGNVDIDDCYSITDNGMFVEDDADVVPFMMEEDSPKISQPANSQGSDQWAHYHGNRDKVISLEYGDEAKAHPPRPLKVPTIGSKGPTTLPPLAQSSIAALHDDLLNVDSGDPLPEPTGRIRRAHSTSNASSADASSAAHPPPSFHDLVKRSTRFITAVPADEVLDKVEGLLEEHQHQRTETPIGIIGKVALHWDSYRLEVWGADVSGPSLCALQLYRLPEATSASYSPARVEERSMPNTAQDLHRLPFPDDVGGLRGRSPSGAIIRQASAPSFLDRVDDKKQPLFLVEFIRGQLDIFAFKRFYQWVRQHLSELVKRDYAFKLFDQAASPMVESKVLNRRFQERFY